MPLSLDWQQITLRLALTVVAGLLIGFNRSEHGRPAGMRTTLLVCLAASIAMIQANLLLNLAGRRPDSFIMLDLMRLPLGILSGMGFIGAGTILRKGSLVIGVTTAATLWFTTVIGLCFGGGQLGLGLIGLALGCATLWGLKYIEDRMRKETHATLTIAMSQDGPPEEEVRAMIGFAGCVITSWGITQLDHGQRREVHAEIQWRTLPGETRPPFFVSDLAKNPHVDYVHWQP